MMKNSSIKKKRLLSRDPLIRKMRLISRSLKRAADFSHMGDPLYVLKSGLEDLKDIVKDLNIKIAGMLPEDELNTIRAGYKKMKANMDYYDIARGFLVIESIDKILENAKELDLFIKSEICKTITEWSVYIGKIGGKIDYFKRKIGDKIIKDELEFMYKNLQGDIKKLLSDEKLIKNNRVFQRL